MGEAMKRSRLYHDLKNWPSRGVIATHDYGCPPHDIEGLKALGTAMARGQAAVLDARIRKGLDVAPNMLGATDGTIRPAAERERESS